MSLEKYKQKRDFNNTPEPTGGLPTDNALHFVVQKHHASHLHYDFRLELRGVLKSWAVPKGISMNPSESRLAMLVEDHPWDYRDFEGVIPSGYGKGTVIVWDEGTYSTDEINENDKKAQEHSITSQFWKGHINFSLHGKKLKGRFSIGRAKDKEESNAWYIHKEKDEYATKEDITLNEASVQSGRTLEEVAANPEREWQSHKPGKNSGKQLKDIKLTGDKGTTSPMPSAIAPMLCTLIREPFTKEGWIYEVKWDGYRIISYKNKNKVTLNSRSGLDYSERYTEVHKALQAIEGSMVLDGEIVAINKEGKVSFDAVQKANPDAPLIYYVFDLLWLNNKNLMNLPLTERKEILKNLLQENDVIKYSDSFTDGIALYEQAQKLELEGIVCKRGDSIYEPGKRGNDWLKLPTMKRQEFVIGGWAESDNGRSFRSLLFGAYNNKKEFEWIGRSGGGYKEKEMPGILKKLQALEINESPFINKVLDTKGAVIHYVKPQLVANFQFATWTTSGRIRKPATFLGFRNDKKAKDVVREVPVTQKQEEKIIEEHAPNNTKNKVANHPKGSNWPEIENLPVTSKDTIDIDDCTIELTNVEKQIWNGVSKADLITYYNTMADYILPHLHNRPLSLLLKPYGTTKPGVYIKDMEGRQPSCAEIFSVKRKHAKQDKGDVIHYLVCNNKATLLYVINLGCIDINPWTSVITDYLHPNYIIVDLDPSDSDFKKVIDTALAAKKVFDTMKLKSFPKTSGKTGMHLFIPCKGFTFAEARTIALKLCQQIQELVPDISTVENTIAKRGNKVFIDYNQNDEGDTVAAPYSVRPGKQPTVSAPLDWKEVNNKLSIENFNMSNIFERIKKKGDLFAEVMNEKIALVNSKVLEKLL